MKVVRQRIAGKAIVEHRSKILILREAGTSYEEGTNEGRWQLPGGRIEVGEDVNEGFAREIEQETGLSAKKGDLMIGNPVYWDNWFPNIKGEMNQIIGVFVACTALTDEVRLSEEHDAYRWINPADYPQYDILAPEDKALDAFMIRSSGPSEK